ncbi:hypothetical protein F442_10308 [Phytophthora nicotianae P10297]|nr:hypothetical protein F442_10308 [Phytophthora nicotianae P10297]
MWDYDSFQHAHALQYGLKAKQFDELNNLNNQDITSSVWAITPTTISSSSEPNMRTQF